MEDLLQWEDGKANLLYLKWSTLQKLNAGVGLHESMVGSHRRRTISVEFDVGKTIDVIVFAHGQFGCFEPEIQTSEKQTRF